MVSLKKRWIKDVRTASDLRNYLHGNLRNHLHLHRNPRILHSNMFHSTHRSNPRNNPHSNSRNSLHSNPHSNPRNSLRDNSRNNLHGGHRICRRGIDKLSAHHYWGNDGIYYNILASDLLHHHHAIFKSFDPSVYFRFRLISGFCYSSAPDSPS